MIEFAFWGQNQTSFKKASEIIKRTYGIEVSYVTLMNVTKYIGKIVYEYNYNEAKENWNKRANLDITCNSKKNLLYCEADGSAVNTRVEDENGSTWRENKLAIFFSDKDMYKRKDKSNMILHKEYVSYVGNVDEFRILLFSKAVELKYWKYDQIIFISDGATWLRNMINELFPEAIQILDKWHLVENIVEYAKFIFNDNTDKVNEFKEIIMGYCYTNDYNSIEKELSKYKDLKRPKSVCNLPEYMSNNRDKINYSTYEKNGWFIGSGAIESSNKTIVQQRLKQAGMRWSVDGANYLIVLKCYVESNRWNEISEIITKALYG